MNSSVANDPLAAIADAAIAHLNSDHADALLAYARGIAGLDWAQSTTVTGIDAGGLDLQVAGVGRQQLARIAFEPPLAASAELRPRLVALAEQARLAVAVPSEHLSPPLKQDAETVERLFNAISNRRSFGLKELSREPIDLELVGQLLEAANWAPSHGKTEPWRFVVYSGDARQIIGDAFGAAFRQLNQGSPPNDAGERAQRDKVWMAPVWIALGMQPDPKMPEWEELIAFGSAVQNAQLMASALGLASKWTSGATAIHPLVAAAVGFAPETQLYGFLYVGRPANEWPAGKRRPLAEKVRWVREL